MPIITRCDHAPFERRGISVEQAIPSGRRVVIVGPTGMVGGNALRYALENSAVGCVTVVAREKLGLSHPKLKEVLHSDFANCAALAAVLSAQDAAIFCLGTYTGVVTDAPLRTVTESYMAKFARVLGRNSPNAAFLFLGGICADPTERRRMSPIRHEGEAENALFVAGFPRVYVFRRAYIYPVKPRKEANFRYQLQRGIHPSFRVVLRNEMIRTDDLARVMVDCAVRGAGETGSCSRSHAKSASRQYALRITQGQRKLLV